MAKNKEFKDRVFYANGVYKHVLEEIIFAQKSNLDKVFYLQPYSFAIINELRDLSYEKGYRWQPPLSVASTSASRSAYGFA